LADLLAEGVAAAAAANASDDSGMTDSLLNKTAADKSGG
jgi:hypothetical protein